MKNKNILVWIILPVFYLFTRLVNLKIIPIFTDEAIYSFWAQVALHDPANRFISLEDGKQPLFIWIAAIFQKFISDPLIATRLVSVLAGLGSLIGIYIVSDLLFKNKKIALLSSILYIILPFTLLYDRMAIFDSLTTMLGIYAVFFSIKMAKDPKLDLALLNGFAIGLGLITKSEALFFLYLLPFSLFLFDYPKKLLKTRAVYWVVYTFVTVIIAEIIYNALRLSQLFYIIARKNLEFIRPFSEVINTPFQSFNSNFHAIIGWIFTYTGPIFFFVFIIGALYGLYLKNRQIIYLLILVFAPFTAEVIFNKVLYARFTLFYFPYIIIITAYAFVAAYENLKKYRRYVTLLLVIGAILPLYTSFLLLTNPTRANIPENDKNQYMNDWPAGYGVPQIIDLLKEQSAKNEVYVGTEGTFGLYPYALMVYFYAKPNIHIYSYWPVSASNLPQQIIDYSKSHQTYFIYNFTQAPITDKHVQLIAKFQKGNGNSYMRLYRVEYDR
jgi:4-amino-4-deoxy-L-arabinose transferase-like glycosyltransferase